MNKLFVIILSLQCLSIIQPVFMHFVVDKGDHEMICSQEPIEIGIVLDSSVSIAEEDFHTAERFLANFLSEFSIGNGENQVRVSIITFGRGIYPQDSFDLDTYSTKKEVTDAILKIPHRAGLRTDTGLAIKYMHNHQLADGKVRPGVEKIGLVITDGNSQSWSTTRREAAKAREDGIVMFAVGVGREDQVGEEELERIAGSTEYVTRVESFDSLDSVKDILATKTCIKKKKPTTTPPPKTQSCGEANPADVQFIFSPSDIGLDGTSWVTTFIENTIDAQDMDVGFRYGVTSGSCPLDKGFNLDTYDFIDDIKEHLSYYDEMKLPHLVNMDVFDSDHGGRYYARDVAVLFLTSEKGAYDLEFKVQQLLANGVEVYIANPAGYPISIAGATPLEGRSSMDQSTTLIDKLCKRD